MVTKQQVKKAGSEIGDLAVLLVDKTSNREQLGQFMTEGFQAVQALAAIGVPQENRAAIASHLAEAILAKLNSEVLVLPEG